MNDFTNDDWYYDMDLKKVVFLPQQTATEDLIAAIESDQVDEWKKKYQKHQEDNGRYVWRNQHGDGCALVILGFIAVIGSMGWIITQII